MFAAEFPGEALDPSQTDWDNEAWAIDRALLLNRRAASFDELRDGGEAWKLYSKTLAAETERLVKEVA